MKPIRIMHVVRTLATGGTETVVRKLMTSLDANRFQQSVCTVVAAPGGPLRNEICFGMPPNKAAFLVPRFARLFARERPDIVHSRNWATIEAAIGARAAGISGVIHSEHGRDLQTMGHQPWRRRVVRRISYACADRVFCVSKELRHYYSQELSLPESRFGVIPNGVDTEHYRPNAEERAKVRKKIGARSGAIVVGTVGRLDPVKDHGTLLRATELALSKGLDLRLLIVGDGPQRAAIERELAAKPEVGSRTILAGDVQNVSDWLSCLDVFVLPSLSEGMSNTLLEAMAVGLPAIATSVGGNSEVVEHERSGLLVQAGDAIGICNCLVALASSVERRGELGIQARERVVAQFSLDRMVKRYEEMYCSMMKPSSVHSPALSRA